MKDYRVVIRPQAFFARIPPSDTLFGALMWAHKEFCGISDQDLGAYLREWQVRPDLLVSSMFPKSQQQHYFPMPVLPAIARRNLKNIGNTHDSREKAKQLKKVLYVEERIFAQIVQGQCTRLSLLQQLLNNECQISHETMLHYKQTDAPHRLYNHDTVQKNQLDRLSGSTTPGGATFYQQQVQFAQRESELWFYLRIPEQKLDTWRTVLRYLGDIGITANRSSGGGRFSVESIQPVALPAAANGNHYVTLSRCLPAPSELNVPNCYYKTVPVRSMIDNGGDRTFTDILKPKFLYIQEGSILQGTQQTITGVSPVVKTLAGQTNIYQYGFAYPIRISLVGVSA